MPDYRYTAKVESADPKKPGGVQTVTGEVTAPSVPDADYKVRREMKRTGFYVHGEVVIEERG